MKTMVVANQKGGVGKTSTLVHIAFDFLERGLRVAVIDLDTQGNASYTLKQFSTNVISSSFLLNESISFDSLTSDKGLFLFPADSQLANMENKSIQLVSSTFRNNIQKLKHCDFDVVLIDTAPSLGVTMAAALFAADFVLSPIELESYSLQGIKKMMTTISQVRKANRGLVFLGMLPSKVDARNPRHKRHLSELEQSYPELLIPASIGLRSSVADALASGIPVWKIRKTAARIAGKEMKQTANYLFEKMGV
ncbi:MAG: ParA family protein [Candidatus Moranbacteria bacterium]|nr:ParA family protein [Candidatus Moranbacteria bacterium]